VDERTEGSGEPTGEGKPDWNQLVGAAAEHAKERKDAMSAVEAPVRKKGKGLLLAALMVVLLAVAGWNYYFFFMAGEPSPEFEGVALQASLYLAQMAVEESWEETGTFPASLEEAGADEEGLSYSTSATGYTLTAAGDRHVFTYERGGDLEPFRSAFQSLLAGEVRR
jgi:hypothetical protein